MRDGKYVLCDSDITEEGQMPHVVDRALCLMEVRAACSTCPKSRFSLRFQLRASDQLVACPRWESEEDRKNGLDTLDYVQVRRDTCLNEKPFPFCATCQNSDPTKDPMIERKWVELEARRRRIERELDEEDLDE